MGGSPFSCWLLVISTNDYEVSYWVTPMQKTLDHQNKPINDRPQAFKPGMPRPEGAGRKKGQVNKITKSVKEALAEAFENMGGIPSLVRWGRLNPGVFYKLWVRLLPIQVTNTVGTPIKVENEHDLSKLSIDELSSLASMIEKTTLLNAAASSSTVLAGMMQQADTDAEAERAEDPLSSEDAG